MTKRISTAAIADATVLLRAAGCVFAEDEAAVLNEAAPDEPTLRELVRRRAGGEPLEQVVGYADFCGIRVRLRPGVFVPRARSEHLVHRGAEAARHTEATRHKEAASRAEAARHTEAASPTEAARRPETATAAPVVVDLCCGSGALGLAVRRQVPGIDLYAADLEPAAVACARDNFDGDRDRVYQGDLFDPLPARLKGHIDVLLANVPYVASRHIAFLPAEARDHEPRRALDGGDDGLDVFRAVISAARAWLSPGATVLSEITQAQVGPAMAAVRAAGLEPEVTYDEDLEATVIAGRC